MTGLVWVSGWRVVARRPLQACLAALGVALGVAAVVGMDIANQSAKRAFAASAEAVAGRATHRIVGGPRGLPEDVYRRLRVELGMRDSAPVVEGYARLGDGRLLRMLGVDSFAEGPFRGYIGAGVGVGGDVGAGGAGWDWRALVSEPGAALVSGETAAELGVGVGDVVDANIGGYGRSVGIVGVIEARDGFARAALRDMLVVDISTAQELAGLAGYVSHIDLALAAGAAGDEWVARIRGILPGDAAVVPASEQVDAVRELTGSFDDDLFMLSLLALIVGAFMVYNAMTFSALRRRSALGTLRALGVTRGQAFTLVMGEALAVGVVGAIVGAAAGVLLGWGLTGVVERTVSDLFYAASGSDLAVPVWSLVKGGLLGVGATLAAAAIPAFEASGAPASSGPRSSLEARVRGGARAAAGVGALLCVAGVGLMFAPMDGLAGAFAGLTALIAGYAMLTPLALMGFSRVAAPAMGAMFGMTGRLAARGLSAALSRTAVAVAALSVAASIIIAIDTMVGSFRGTLVDWLEVSLGSDVYITSRTALSPRLDAGLSPLVAARVRGAAGVGEVKTIRSVVVGTSDGDVRLTALGTGFDDFNMPRRYKAGDPAAIWDEWQRGDVVVVSEPYAYRSGAGVGDYVRFRTARGERDFRIGGVYYDYGSAGRGAALMSRAGYDRFWDDERYTSIGVDAAAGVSAVDLAADLRRAIGDAQEVDVRLNGELRAAALEVFERSFAITSATRALAMAVACVGVFSALTAMQLERGREFGTLRALGFTGRRVWGLVTAQTGLLGLAAGVFALPLGLLEAAALIFVVNRRSFGWTMRMELDAMVLGQALALAVVAALLAGAYPALRARRAAPAEALREE